MLGIEFKSHKVLDVLPKNLAQHHGIIDFQLPMSLICKFNSYIEITTTDDERNLSLVMVNSTGQIRAKCDFELKDMEKFFWEGREKGLPCTLAVSVIWANFFPYLPKEIFPFPSNLR